MVAPAGPLATIDGKLRQARKGATVAIDSCAGVWLVGVHHPNSPSFAQPIALDSLLSAVCWSALLVFLALSCCTWVSALAGETCILRGQDSNRVDPNYVISSAGS